MCTSNVSSPFSTKGPEASRILYKTLPTEHLSEAVSDSSIGVSDRLPNLFLAVK